MKVIKILMIICIMGLLLEVVEQLGTILYVVLGGIISLLCIAFVVAIAQK